MDLPALLASGCLIFIVIDGIVDHIYLPQESEIPRW